MSLVHPVEQELEHICLPVNVLEIVMFAQFDIGPVSGLYIRPDQLKSLFGLIGVKRLGGCDIIHIRGIIAGPLIWRA